MAEDSIFSLGDKLYSDILTTIVACAVLGLVIMSVVIRCVTRPVYRLMDSIRSGIAGLKEFAPSGIQEVDELHQVVENLTESEISTEHQLSEEKERYRIAVESSNDLFFTYREKGNTLEIVNSREMDGLWDIKNAKKKTVIFQGKTRKSSFLCCKVMRIQFMVSFAVSMATTHRDAGSRSEERPLQRQKRMIERS